MTKPAKFDVRYDRRVDPDFLALFLDGGPLSRLRDISQHAAFPLDLQMRRDPKNPNKQWATLYVGLTGVLYVYAAADGVKFDAHDTWSGKKSGKSIYGFRQNWFATVGWQELAYEWEAIELYLEKVIPAAVRGHALTEGAVQTVVSKRKGVEWAVLDREVVASYRDTDYKKQVLVRAMAPILAVETQVRALGGRFPQGPAPLGPECDLLAVDRDGRLLAIEVKPASGGAIAWVPAQAAMYARLLQQWIDAEPDVAREVISGTLDQRQALGHAKGFTTTLPRELTVVPVVVLQRGSTDLARNQMHRVREAINAHVDGVPAVEVYEVSILGDFAPLT